ncbi:MAG: hypothetical protein ACPLXO_02330, partial [Desulfurella sp.]
MQKGLERIKKAYLILDDNLLARLLQYLLTSEGWSVEWVDDPRQMKEEIFNYNLILIGNHKGITTKVKLAEAFLEKINSGNLAPGLVKPSI